MLQRNPRPSAHVNAEQPNLRLQRHEKPTNAVAIEKFTLLIFHPERHDLNTPRLGAL